MATILHIAGHGKRRDGTFDPGASGYIKEGEWRYYANKFFDFLKKYEPKGHKVIYHTAYNVFSYGNIVSLARKYGKDVIVVEWHFDASGSPSASGGHVIVYSGFVPDELDLRLRDGIKDMVGIRYSHRGHSGISGRSNLANVNRTAKGGVDYRLVELGFGTSPVDSKVMLNKMDQFAKVMSESIYNTEIKKPQQQDSMAGYHVVKSGDTLWAIAQQYGVTDADLKAWNTIDKDLIFPGQSLEVQGSDLPGPKPEVKPSSTPTAKPSNQIKRGAWVRIPANKLYSTGDSSSPVKSRELSAQVDTINNSWKNPIRLIKNGTYQGFARPSDITGGAQSVVQRDTAEQVARDIAFSSHNWGNNPERARKLNKAGYDAQWVQDRVNVLLGTKSKPVSKPVSKSVSKGSTVTARRLYATSSSTKNVRSSNITGYVDTINNGWTNEIRLRNKKGGHYIGFTRKQDLV